MQLHSFCIRLALSLNPKSFGWGWFFLQHDWFAPTHKNSRWIYTVYYTARRVHTFSKDCFTIETAAIVFFSVHFSFFSSDLCVSMVWSNNIVRLPLSPESGGIILWDDEATIPLSLPLCKFGPTTTRAAHIRNSLKLSNILPARNFRQIFVEKYWNSILHLCQ